MRRMAASMARRLLAAALGVAALASAAQPVIAAAPPATEAVLLLYDSLGAGTAQAGSVADMQRMLSACGVQTVLRGLAQYRDREADSYARVVAVLNGSEQPPEYGRLLSDLSASGADLLQIGGADQGSPADPSASSSLVPASVQASRLTVLPSWRVAPQARLHLARRLKEWLGQPADGRLYALVKDAGPFADLSLLKLLADRLNEAGIPFALSAAPVFSNMDFPAMDTYMDTLRYVQTRNGSILVQAPYVLAGVQGGGASLGKQMESYIDKLVSSKIAPLGVGAELYWSLDKQYASAGLGFFDSAVLFPDQAPVYMEPTSVSKPFSSSLYSVAPEFLDELGLRQKPVPLPMDMAVTISMPRSGEEVEQTVRLFKSYWAEFADYRQTKHQVTTASHIIESAYGGISVDHKPLYISRTVPVASPSGSPDGYQYEPEHQESFTAFYSWQNRLFTIIVMSSLVVLGGLLAIGRRMYRRKYFK